MTLAVNKEFICKAFTFNPAFPSDSVKVQTALFMSSGLIYEAAVNWAELVTKSGFTACLETAGPSSLARNLTISWFAYDLVPNRGSEGTHRFPLWTTGTTCRTVTFIDRVSDLGPDSPSNPELFVGEMRS